MVNVSLTRVELSAIMRLVVANQNSAKLQDVTFMSYMESIKLHNKLQKYVGK